MACVTSGTFWFVFLSTDKASGSSIDWVYNNLGTQYCFAPELRDKGVYGFLAPSSEINPSANEVYAAIKVIGNEIIP